MTKDLDWKTLSELASVRDTLDGILRSYGLPSPYPLEGRALRTDHGIAGIVESVELNDSLEPSHVVASYDGATASYITSHASAVEEIQRAIREKSQSSHLHAGDLVKTDDGDIGVVQDINSYTRLVSVLYTEGQRAGKFRELEQYVAQDMRRTYLDSIA